MDPKTIVGCVLVLLAITGIAIAGCTTTTPAQPVSLTVRGTPTGQPVSGSEGTHIASAQAIADANNWFALDLYSRLAADPAYSGSNLFFSPFSISSALAITYEGARGATADEIRLVFHFPADDMARRQGFSEINADINNRSTSYTLRTANALWAEKTCPFLPGYISTAQRYYSANTTNLDFISHPEDSRKTINRWVENKTENNIRDLIPAGVIDPSTRLVITNAIYFKGTWVKQFDRNKTSEENFRIAPDTTVRVRMMQRTDENAVYRYAETGDIQVLEMPYAHGTGKELSMLVILPKGNNLTAAENALDPKILSDIKNSSSSRQVKVYFPKFKLETGYSLPGTLRAMGMRAAFTAAADFSGMDGTKSLFISDVIHKAFVDVNEEGTEAAGATAVVMKRMAVRPEDSVPVFRADHPFLFLIQDTGTGNILFIGRVVNPAGS
jgi:serpin B